MTAFSRRHFLAGAVLLAGCGGKDAVDDVAIVEGDTRVLALLAGVENVAIATYDNVVEANAQGKYGKLPSSVVSVVQLMQAHHRAHAQLWNDVLGRLKSPPVPGVDETLRREVIDPQLAATSDLPSVLRLVVTMEDVLAQTMQQALFTMTDADARSATAGVHPVEAQHAAVARIYLGQYPSPLALAETPLSRGVSDLIS